MGPLLAACFVRLDVLARTLERIYIHSNMYMHTTNIMSSSHWLTLVVIMSGELALPDSQTF
jgi:hypothetical protein